MTNLPDDPLARPLAPSPDAVDSQVGDETVILHLGSGTYFGLDPVGTFIWDRLKEGTAPADLPARLAGAFDVAADRAAEDARRLLRDLLAQGLLVEAA